MLKIAVYDSGMGGELFADYLKKELPIVEIIRVIDWRHASEIIKNRRKARFCAEEALKPYIGKVDLIIIANHLLSLTSLKYFIHKYPRQSFLGFRLPTLNSIKRGNTLILTTSTVAKTLRYHLYLYKLGCKTMTITLDDLPDQIDDAKFSLERIKTKIVQPTIDKNFKPKKIILACSHFSALEVPLHKVFGLRTKILDSYFDTFYKIHHILGIRSYFKKK